MSLGEAARRFVRAGPLDVLYGAATAEPSVTSEMIAEPIKQAWEMVTSLPGLAGQVGRAFWDNFKGVYGSQPQALESGVAKSGKLASGVMEGVKQAVTQTPKAIGTTLQGAGALLAPEKIPPPSEERMREAAAAAPFAALTAATGGPAVLQVGKGIAKYVRNAPVRKGYTTLDPATGKPIPRAAPVQVPLGESVPDNMPGGGGASFYSSITTAAKSLC